MLILAILVNIQVSQVIINKKFLQIGDLVLIKLDFKQDHKCPEWQVIGNMKGHVILHMAMTAGFYHTVGVTDIKIHEYIQISHESDAEHDHHLGFTLPMFTGCLGLRTHKTRFKKKGHTRHFVQLIRSILLQHNCI